MKFLLATTVIFSFLFFAFGERVRYDNYKLYRFTPQSNQELSTLTQLRDHNPGVLFWKTPGKLGGAVDVVFPPHLQGDTLDFLLESIRSSKVITNNVQSVIDQESQTQRRHKRQSGVNALNWDSYGTLGEIYDFIETQAAQHSNIARILEIGRTYENRSIKLLKISKQSGSNRPAIWMDAGIHAREWIAPAVGTYVINELLNGNDTEVAKILDDFDIYAVPALNPDGYEYTHTTDRMWRKTRVSTNSTVGCRGIDANRNWDYHFNTGGSSSDPCQDNFHGLTPFSSEEAKAASDFFNTIANQTKMFLTLHSLGQLIMFPYGFSCEHHDDTDEWTRIGRATADAIEKPFGTKFTTTNVCEQVRISSGGSVDWIKGVHNISIIYAFELRDTGEFEFILPPDQIRPSGIEFMEGFKELVRQLRSRIGI